MEIMEQKSIYRNVTIYHTLPECLLAVGNLYAEKPAITMFGRDRKEQSVTYKEFVKDVQGAAFMMEQRNMSGRHIALVGENSYEWIVAFFAAGCICSVAVPIDVAHPE